MGDNSVVEPYCFLGAGEFNGTNRLIIGDNAHLRSHSIFYLGSNIGRNFKTGHNVVIREKSQIGNNCIFGTSTEAEGYFTVGDFVFIYNNVHLCQGSSIGSFVWIFPYCIFTNDPHPPSIGDMGPTIADYAILATRITVLPGCQIGRDAFVGSHTLVNRNVPDLTIAAGNPMSLKGSVDRIRLTGTNKAAYPWRRHYHSRPDHIRFPTEIIQQWKEEFPDG